MSGRQEQHTQESGNASSFRERLARSASAPTTTAIPICQRNALPNRVWSTESTVDQRNASLRPKPPATAPWSTMQSAPAKTSPKARPARIR